MSTTSMATILAKLDLTLGDDTVIAIHICVVIASWGSGTLLDPTSFREEDAIELCIGLGQGYLKGVPQISYIKTILEFSSGP